MSINPANPGSPRSPGAADPANVTRRPPVGGDGPTPVPSSADEVADRVEISEAARELSLRAAPDGERALAPERLKEILGRLASGYYDRPEVQEVVARRALTDLSETSGA
jgi:hypothetical protein